MATSYSPKIVTDGLILALDAANPRSYPGTGTTWNDISGNNYNGTLVNTPTLDPENVNSFSFDGVDEYCSINYIPLRLTTEGTRTIEIWTKINSFPASSTGGGLFAGQKNTTGALMVLNTGKYSWYWDDSVTVESTVTIQIGKWYQIVIILEPSAQATYYTNGVLDRSKFTTSDTSSGQVTVWSIARQNRDFSGNFLYLNCNVSIARQYDRILSADEILQNYNATKSRYGL